MAKNPHAVALGKLGGSVSSPRKAAAARKNAKKGGRPKWKRASSKSEEAQDDTARQE